ncbi:SulP family inorganic anion transporter [Methylorubrum extorquens]|uniref:SulP family inorganic anion transporter n=1 Tax=Methylorubrum extorquens TaxID=408 RepID=UPI002AA2A9B3|nr:SulP family inorganic anion transporter [Methylorubrum extorquens]
MADRRPQFRFEVVAGLTAATVVLVSATAYATLAGLPAAVGLYAAQIPSVIYGLLGSSRVISMNSMMTLAVLTGAELGSVAPNGDPERRLIATVILVALVVAFSSG